MAPLIPVLLGLTLGLGARATPPPPPAHPSPPPASDALTITVKPQVQYQQIDGIGVSEAFQRSNVLYGLNEPYRSEVLDLLFTAKGAGLTILRNGIGSSVSNPWDLMASIAPVAPASNSSALNFIPLPNDDQHQVWLAKQAKARGTNYFYADAWSADPYMKTNNNENFGGNLCGVRNTSCATGDWRQSYASKLVRFLQLYKAQGITYDYVGFLNEPDFNASYAGMLSDGLQAADFIEVLAPALKKAGLRTEIACCEGTGWDISRQLLEGVQSAGQEKNIGLVTSHGYSSAPGAPLNTSKKVWQTEWSTFDATNYDWYSTGKSSDGLAWANNIQKGFRDSNLNGHIYWWGAANASDNEPLIFINNTAEVRVTARLWAHAHFGSKFVRKDAHRIEATIGSAALNVSAFQNVDKSISVQIINNGNTPQDVVVKGFGPRGRISTFLTNNANNLTRGEARVDPQGARASIPAFSLLSFLYTR
ncbi:glycoside hydrolase superfamily [Elsinoe ampelina]|uniref:Glycoside hydrolase superfamily n=1 Tax=Elsinoe ampelina TaxID=302913 RepID=A0A6A6GJC3_9PEZI|nr:glycoside hydrolase superfamily [Elsinoe ampelina]